MKTHTPFILPSSLRVLVMANIRTERTKATKKLLQYGKEKGSSTTGVACGFSRPPPTPYTLHPFSIFLSLFIFFFIFSSSSSELGEKSKRERAASINPLVSVSGLASYD
ncbi:hypothetical protein CEXT_324451 [Caerostris extrusa]|uniref:Transmembrane protein n=1 Tax=Caerostris extrusa TaxID=172846 RepID=A0AAV4UT67_CAEEX|nr:hypothetical protein CEXT_324451 [Caerostris extrusa]